MLKIPLQGTTVGSVQSSCKLSKTLGIRNQTSLFFLMHHQLQSTDAKKKKNPHQNPTKTPVTVFQRLCFKEANFKSVTLVNQRVESYKDKKAISQLSPNNVLGHLCNLVIYATIHITGCNCAILRIMKQHIHLKLLELNSHRNTDTTAQ